MEIQSDLHNSNLQGTGKISSNYGKFELQGLIMKGVLTEGPSELVRIMESSNYRGSNYGGPTVYASNDEFIYLQLLKRLSPQTMWFGRYLYDFKKWGHLDPPPRLF